MSVAFAKATHIFFSKNTCELDIVLTGTGNILTNNELVKLMMLRTTGPLTIRRRLIKLIATSSFGNFTSLWSKEIINAFRWIRAFLCDLS